jgi:hypothetical protein
LSADITTLNLNSTANLSGGTAGQVTVHGALNATSLIIGGTYPTFASGMNMSGQSYQPSIEFYLGSTTPTTTNALFLQNQSIYGTNDLLLQWVMTAGSQFAVLEAFAAKNLVLSTGGSTYPVSFAVNRTLLVDVTTTSMNPHTTGTYSLGTSSLVYKNLYINKAFITTGSNASIGTAVLVAGTVTVSTTAVTASSIIFLTCQVLGTVTVASALSIGTVTAGTSFVINSAVVTDTSTIGWWIIN